MAPLNSALADDFLAEPAPNIIVERIDFTKSSLPAYSGLYAVVIDNALKEKECEELLYAAEATTTDGWERAQLNVGGGRQKLVTDVRNCGRIIWDSREVVAKIWKRIEHLPEVQEITRLDGVPRIFGNGPAKRGEVWKMTRPNERMRFLKYMGGEYFRPHCDGTYETPDGKERTYVTLHLYLNDHASFCGDLPPLTQQEERLEAASNQLQGGATTFHSLNMREKLDVLPKAGRILLFQHRYLLHSGDDVSQGVKYTMRTDLLYSMESSRSEEKSKGRGVLIESVQDKEKARNDAATKAMEKMIAADATTRFGF